MSTDYIKRQVELRAQAWEQAKALLDTAANEKRDLTSSENETYERIVADMDSRAKVIESLKADAEREERQAQALHVAADVVRPTVPSEARTAQSDSDRLRALARGEVRSIDFTEQRDIVPSSTGAPVPTSFYDEVIMKARLVGPMLDLSTVLTTTGGENLQIPSLNAYSAATIKAPGAAIDESDPTFNSFVTLGAHKYGFLVQVARELIEDAGVDIQSFIADQVGNALGYSVNTDLTVGDGSNKPNGVATRAAAGVTGATNGGAFTADELVDLLYSLDGAARRLPGFGWMMNGSSIAAVRKLKDTVGQYLFQPSLAAGTPDMLLGYPVYENPAMDSVGASKKSVIVGHLPSYYVRQVGGIRLDRSDDFAFANDLVTFRATWRGDGNLIQTSHIKAFTGKAGA